MNRLVWILMLWLAACSAQVRTKGGQRDIMAPNGSPASASTSCTVVQGLGSATISCPDGTSASVSDGSRGIAGAQGVAGVAGPVGPQGVAGANGAAGPQGAAGPHGATGLAGPVGPQGPQGLIGPQGSIGATGPMGLIGPQGLQGAPGLSGADVAAVKLCHDDTSTYPEYGLKLGGQLFAVYWGPNDKEANSKVFLTLLAPGLYENRKGNGCSFRVHSDGSVTEN